MYNNKKLIKNDNKYNFVIGRQGYGKSFYFTQKFIYIISKDIINNELIDGKKPKYISMNTYTKAKITYYILHYLFYVYENLFDFESIYGVKILIDNDLHNFEYKLIKE